MRNKLGAGEGDSYEYVMGTFIKGSADIDSIYGSRRLIIARAPHSAFIFAISLVSPFLNISSYLQTVLSLDILYVLPRIKPPLFPHCVHSPVFHLSFSYFFFLLLISPAGGSSDTQGGPEMVWIIIKNKTKKTSCIQLFAWFANACVASKLQNGVFFAQIEVQEQ